MALFILVWGCFRNYLRARVGQLNAGRWAVATFFSILVAWFVGALIMVVIMVIKDPQLRVLMTKPDVDREELLRYTQANMNATISEVFMMVCAIGGYLFVRYMLIRKLPPQEESSG